ncbi:MAG: elongation factor G [Candidatus Atribacteria bacterium]|nr:elongation factor G [Candidatus Atribacteria bacterium]
MKKYDSKDIRNVGLFSHAGAGKTTLAEALLYHSGLISRKGKVEEGNTVSDWEPEEIKRGISIDLSVLPFEWQGKKINLIDTPGYADFVGNVLGALRAVDCGLIPVCGVSGVEVGVERSWTYLEKNKLPVFFFINKMDRDGANFDKVLREIQNDLSSKATPLYIPIGKESNFQGVVDVLAMKALYFQADGKSLKEDTIPTDLQNKAQEIHDFLVENIAETNDELLNMYLEGQAIDPEILKETLRQAILQRKLFPVLCGSGLTDRGVSLLGDALCHYAPSPLDRPPIQGMNPKTNEVIERKCSETEPFSAYVYKIISDPYVGKLALVRVFSGKLTSDSRLFNASRNTEEKVGQLLTLRGKYQESVTEIGPGDMGAIAKINEIYLGDTISEKEKPIVFANLKYPEANYLSSVKPLGRGDEDKISLGISRMLEEDPTIKEIRDPDTKEYVLYGYGDIHLDVLIEKMKRKFGVEVGLAIPKVPYKETIKGTTKVEGKYKRQSGGRGQYGHCWLELEPLPRGKGFEFVDKIVGGAIPRNYIPSVEKGVQEAMLEGVLAGYPIIDIRVTVYDGSFHPVDSSDMAFKIAGSMALKKGCLECNPVLLEPIMNLEITVPEEYMGDVIGDINSRRGRILGMDPQDGYQVIRANVPLAEIFRYSVDLRSLTQGRGSYKMTFSNYEEVPAQIAEGIIQKAKKEKEEAG